MCVCVYVCMYVKTESNLGTQEFTETQTHLYIYSL